MTKEFEPVTIKRDSTFTGTSGLAGFLSWDRLEKLLHSSGELKNDERVEGYRIYEHGVDFYIVKVNKDGS